MDDLALAISAADVADRMTMAAFTGESLPFIPKADGTPLTETDTAVEYVLRDLIAQHRPDDRFLGEETGEASIAGGAGGPRPARDRRWVIDPIDGTRAFIAGDRRWGTQIGLEVDGRVALGLTSAPALGLRWWGSVEQGTWARHQGGEQHRLMVSRGGVGDTLRWTCQPAPEVCSGEWRTWVDALRGIGTYVPVDTAGALMVAGGAVDVCLQLEGAAWDYAGFVGIVVGAGGRFSYLDGSMVLRHAYQPGLFSNSVVHEMALERLQPRPA